MKPVHWVEAARVGLACLGLVVVLGACTSEPPPTDSLYVRRVTGDVFDITPVRGEVKPLRLHRGGFAFKCTECHTDFSSPKKQGDLEGEHVEINTHFMHGMNTNCLNCHNRTNRDVYVGRDGEPIPSTDSVRLCAMCHGPIYREWKEGIHGRRNGSWERSNPKQTKLLCIQCHDPHHPRFELMTPEPPTMHTRFERASSHRAMKTESAQSAH